MSEHSEFMAGSPATSPPPIGTGEFTAGLLQATLSTRRVQAIVALSWSGPQIDSYSVSLGLGEKPEAVEALAGALALAAGAESCRVGRIPGKLLLEVPKPADQRKPLLASRLETLAPATATSVCLGITTGGVPIWIDLADERYAHIILGGTTGSGKSVLLRWALYRLIMQNPTDNLRLLMIDPKRFELKQFARVPHLLHEITSSPNEVARLLAWVNSELDRRADTGRSRPRIVVVIEEVADLAATNREVLPLLARVAQIGRALGINLLATTQTPGAKALGSAVGNFPTRIIGRIASSTLAYGASGRARTGADALLGKGDLLLVSAGETTRFQAPLPDGRQWARLPIASTSASLDEQLPTLVRFADANRDPRGGRGRREIEEDDYRAIERALAGGATVRQVMERFSIGYERAQRMYEAFLEVHR